MADATPTQAPPVDAVTGISFDWIHICPKDKILRYTMADEFQSGEVKVRNEVTLKTVDFQPAIAAFRATGQKGLLQFLVANNYEKNLTVL